MNRSAMTERTLDAVAPEAALVAPLDVEWLSTSFVDMVEGLQRNWAAAASAVSSYSQALMEASLGLAAGEPAAPVIEPRAGDKRFGDDAWREDPFFRGVQQAYLLWEKLLDDLIEAAGLDGRRRDRAAFVVRAVTDALAPTNFFWTNPEAIRRAIETGGESVAQGLRNMAEDLEHNGGRPRQVDSTPFRLGDNLAASPGRVVYRNDIMELIQYDAQTEQVHAVPLLVSPPWINKYYILDLAPGRSFIEWAVQHGHTVFAISYRNPDHLLRHHRLDDYLLDGPRAALDVIEDITGSPKANIAALCVGGTLTGMLLSWLRAGGESRVESATLLNTLLDFEDPGVLGLFTDREAVERIVETMSHTGYLKGSAMAGTFDALRANDLIWNYVARNWLMGESPSAFDILTWNADSTRLPEALHAFYLRSCYVENQLARGVMELAGVRLSLSDVTEDVFMVAAQNDHIVPWRSAYRGAQHLGGNVTFVLTSAGHIAGVVNPPNPKSRHWTNDRIDQEPAAWLAGAAEHQGSWWERWAEWVRPHAGPLRPPPLTGSTSHPPLDPAPGHYVHES